MALIEKLSAIGDAIRAKTGETELLRLDQMPEAIAAIETGGGGGAEIPEDFFLITGNCPYRFTNNNMNFFLENELYKNKWHSNEITNSNYMFANSSELEKVEFGLHYKTGSISAPTYINYTFNNSGFRELPELLTEVYGDGISNLFSGCKYIREIPQSWYNNLNYGYMQNQNYASAGAVFQGCSSLRRVNADFIRKCRGKETTTSSSSTILYSGFNGCYALDEIVGLPTVGTFTNNVLSMTCTQCGRLKNVLFDMNEDGTPMIANWKSQTMDLTNNVGYVSGSTWITGYNSGITNDTRIINEESYEQNKNNIDSWTPFIEYSRYNHDSAVNTINSLPDTSVYLAANGGTNTIKFKGASGSATDGGAINTLTAEEIAVATAKGWTVSLT